MHNITSSLGKLRTGNGNGEEFPSAWEKLDVPFLQGWTRTHPKSARSTSYVSFQNQEMLTEGDLANSMDQTDKVREMQDKIARLRAQVSKVSFCHS